MGSTVEATHRRILQAALKYFANSGYAATSVQEIVDAAGVSKPALYYHFRDKAGLFQAVVNQAHEERYRVIQAAIAGTDDIRRQLENILSGLHDFFRANRELVRIGFATMFAAPGEMPANLSCVESCERNFELVHGLMQRAQTRGQLNPRYDSRQLAFGFYGLANVFLVHHLVYPAERVDYLTVPRIVELFLAGAAGKEGIKVKTKSKQRKRK